ncbi:hypothetical protein J2X65_002011 [Ancylobacter sp. 3268]|uniref:hypothetical protein n=1 Tax=Ancylobacter sp. 3268 TaxID=2817752 RepID=UPI00285A180D|nr:hypothetical protein [Ancylobacter sp. 3268]MDR6952652.1 hypothetical protein [Ancylobacter sp. 3268]
MARAPLPKVFVIDARRIRQAALFGPRKKFNGAPCVRVHLLGDKLGTHVEADRVFVDRAAAQRALECRGGVDR